MLYDYECRTCGKRQLNVVNRIAERKTNAPDCCGEKMSIIILAAPMGFVDNMEEYWCPVTGEGVTSRRQRNEIMKREGLLDANDFLKSDEERKKQSDEWAAKKKKLDEAKPKEVQEYVDNWAMKELGL